MNCIMLQNNTVEIHSLGHIRPSGPISARGLIFVPCAEMQYDIDFAMYISMYHIFVFKGKRIHNIKYNLS